MAVTAATTPRNTTIVTLALDAASQARFDALRRRHYPPALNQIAAHLTLFHTLPASDEVQAALAHEAAATHTFAMQVSGVRSLGRGVAYTLQSAELTALHQRLSRLFAGHLTPQDRHGFRPHVVVQNKVSHEAARNVLEELQAGFEAWDTLAVGLEWWEYLGGPWRLIERMPFLADTIILKQQSPGS